MRRYLSLFLAVLILSSLLISCGDSGKQDPTQAPTQTPTQAPTSTPASTSTSTEEPDDVDGNALPFANGDVTFDIWWAMDESAAPFISDLATNIAWSEVIKRTGVNLHFISQPAITEGEQFNLMIASQDYPDIIKNAGALYSGGIDKAIADDVYIRLNELIEDHAPNYLRRLREPDDAVRDVLTDSGNMIFAQIYNRRQSGFFGPLIRQDWLDDLNLKIPVTIADWENVLTQFKNEKTNGSGPLQFNDSGFNYGENFSGAFGVGGQTEGSAMVLVDGKVQYSFLMPEMRDYLETMNRWYEAGLIDQEFPTRGFQLFANTTRLANNELGAFISFFNQAGTFYKDSGVMTDDNFFLSLAPIPRLTADSEPTVGLRMMRAVAGMGAITTACEDPVLAVKLIDYLFSDEGALLANYGLEGETFDYNADNKPVLKDIIIHNTEGMTATTAQFRYLIHNGPMFFYLDREEDVLDEEGKKYVEMWDLAYPRTITGISFTSDEGTEKANIMNDINTLVSESVVKFITGTKPFSEYDAFVSQIESMNIDKVIDMYTESLSRYQNR